MILSKYRSIIYLIVAFLSAFGASFADFLLEIFGLGGPFLAEKTANIISDFGFLIFCSVLIASFSCVICAPGVLFASILSKRVPRPGIVYWVTVGIISGLVVVVVLDGLLQISSISSGRVVFADLGLAILFGAAGGLAYFRMGHEADIDREMAPFV